MSNENTALDEAREYRDMNPFPDVIGPYKFTRILISEY